MRRTQKVLKFLKRNKGKIAIALTLLFLPLEALPIILVLSWMSLFIIYGIKLVRAESPEEQARAQRVIAGCIIAGVLMAIAKPMAEWSTGIDFDNPSGDLPPELIDAANRLLNLLMYIGAVVVIGGLVYGGIQLSRRNIKGIPDSSA